VDQSKGIRLKFLPKIVGVLIVTLLAAPALRAQNLIVNPGFENNPPPNLGNNIGHPILPWTLGTGNSSNVVAVDGGTGYGNGGPRLDADPATGAGTRQHYLDIASGANDFYQSFTVPTCGGPAGQVRAATFSGWFSTRDNLSGNGSVSIRAGAGTGGTALAMANAILPPPAPLTSATAPWVQVSGTVNVTTGSTISYVVSMDNNLNFDEAFLSFDSAGCVTSTITLQKAWVGAAVGDTASVTLSRGPVPIESLASSANTANEVDADGTPAIGFQGETLALAETLGAGNAGLYAPVLSCTGGGTLSGTTLTVGDAGAPIVCRYTNNRVTTANLTLTKTNSPGVNNEVDQPGDTLTRGDETSYAITVTNTGPAAANGTVVSDPVPAGLDCFEAVCAVTSGAAVCPAVTVGDLSSGVTIATLPASSALTFTLTCRVL
jgi:uncharacterized repeat protein (TIGR01451 family)